MQETRNSLAFLKFRLKSISICNSCDNNFIKQFAKPITSKKRALIIYLKKEFRLVFCGKSNLMQGPAFELTG